MKNIIKIINSNLPKGFKLKIFYLPDFSYKNVILNLILYDRYNKSSLILVKSAISKTSIRKLKKKFIEEISPYLLSVKGFTIYGTLNFWTWAELVNYITVNNCLPNYDFNLHNLIEIKI